MSLVETAMLFAAMVILALVPSTSVALVVTRSATAGFGNGAAAAAGIVVGDLVFVFLVIFGMAALAEVMGGLFVVLRYLAAAYLIWFGINLLRSRPVIRWRAAGRPVSKLSASFLAGLLLTLGDVKAIFFYASLFPVFVNLGAITTADIAIIGLLTLVAVGGIKLGYAFFAQVVLSLAGIRRAERVAKLAAGSFMVGAGAYLIARA
ncbi:MAG: LysE family translocator [Marinobacter sp.]|nr:LysE family translocator [Marinobacter sp.]